MKTRSLLLAAVVAAGLQSLSPAGHMDISPFFDGSRLTTGGLDHLGTSTPPTVSVYGYDFGEDPLDPFNPSDPGVNQKVGTGSLPAGASLRYDILGSLLYWDGTDPVSWTTPPASSYLGLTMGATTRTLTGVSGAQPGGPVQTIADDGTVHKHFTSSLFAGPGTPNVPGEPGYIAPLDGIYAFSLDLELGNGGSTYASDPLWVVLNNGLTEEQHDAAINSLVPEPGTALVLSGVVAVLGRRRRATRC